MARAPAKGSKLASRDKTEACLDAQEALSLSLLPDNWQQLQDTLCIWLYAVSKPLYNHVEHIEHLRLTSQYHFSLFDFFTGRVREASGSQVRWGGAYLQLSVKFCGVLKNAGKQLQARRHEFHEGRLLKVPVLYKCS